MKTNYAKRIPIPAQDAMNGGLKSPKNASVVQYLGKITDHKAKSLLATVDVGPFEIYGNRLFLAALGRALAKAKEAKPDLVAALKNSGCYNFRPVRGSTTSFSDHSWGGAIDLRFGNAVTPRGSNQTEQGLLELYPFMHNEMLYWGAEFPTDDGMHFGTSLELLQKWDKDGLI